MRGPNHQQIRLQSYSVFQYSLLDYTHLLFTLSVKRNISKGSISPFVLKNTKTDLLLAFVKLNLVKYESWVAFGFFKKLTGLLHQQIVSLSCPSPSPINLICFCIFQILATRLQPFMYTFSIFTDKVKIVLIWPVCFWKMPNMFWSTNFICKKNSFCVLKLWQNCPSWTSVKFFQKVAIPRIVSDLKSECQ